MKRTLKRGLKVREMAKMEGIIVCMDIYIILQNRKEQSGTYGEDVRKYCDCVTQIYPA